MNTGIFKIQELLKEIATEKTKIPLPPKYKVILMNDDFTTMEFVVFILQKVFLKSMEESEAIMLKIHKEGSAVVNVYTEEIAATKVSVCLSTAKAYGFPLFCFYEPEE